MKGLCRVETRKSTKPREIAVKMSLSLDENAAEGMKVAYENGWFNLL